MASIRRGILSTNLEIVACRSCPCKYLQSSSWHGNIALPREHPRTSKDALLGSDRDSVQASPAGVLCSSSSCIWLKRQLISQESDIVLGTKTAGNFPDLTYAHLTHTSPYHHTAITVFQHMSMCMGEVNYSNAESHFCITEAHMMQYVYENRARARNATLCYCTYSMVDDTDQAGQRTTLTHLGPMTASTRDESGLALMITCTT